MIVNSAKVTKVCVLTGSNEKRDYEVVKTAFMSLFEIDVSSVDTRNWTPAEQRSWIEYVSIHHVAYGTSELSVFHVFQNFNTGESLAVIGGACLSQIYWACENGDESQLIVL